MSRTDPKKPSPPKCRGCKKLLGGNVVRIGGHRWHVACAKVAGKYMPKQEAKQDG